jgi:MFS family permease
MDFQQTQRRKFFDYAWIIVGVCFTTLALSYGIWYSFSVFFVALLKEFGWSRSIGAGALSILGIVEGITRPFAGYLLDRIGPKKVLVIGSFFLAVGLALSSLTQTWWHLYVFFGVIMGLGIGATGWISNTTIIQYWFKEGRGLAIGIISSGVGVGMLCFVPLIQYSIDQVGWRMTYRLMAVFAPLIIASAAILFYRNIPPHARSSGEDQSRPGDRDPQALDKDWTSRSWTIRKAMGTEAFWLLVLSYSLSNIATQAILIHQVAFFVDKGLNTLSASYIVGMIGVTSIGGKILWGSLSDRIGREVTYTLGIFCAVIGILFLIGFHFKPVRPLTYGYVLFFGLGYAVTAALPPVITADFFEGRRYGGIFGTLMVLNGVGGAAGNWFAGFMYDLHGNYLLTFVVMIGCVLVTVYTVWRAAPRKIRRVPGQQPSKNTG